MYNVFLIVITTQSTVYYASVTRHNVPIYFMAMIDSVFCLDARAIYKRKTLSVITFKWSEIMDTYSTLDTILRDKTTK